MPIYMRIEGIDGESNSEGHRGWFDVMSFSWGVSNPHTGGGGGGGGAGRATFSDLSVMKACGKGSPNLMLACAGGRHLPAVQFDITVFQGDRETLLQHYLLNDCFITEFATNGDGNASPTESMSLNFGRIDFIQRFFGGDGGTQEAFWDVRRNQGGGG